ncbi:MAG: hypothetical protein KF888_04155 [Nitrosomonas sp.]|nr:hypothetical protein [Nitrosomonas sp.]
MAAMISLCANLNALESIEQSLKQNVVTSINSNSSLLKCKQEKHSSSSADPDILAIDANAVLHIEGDPSQHTVINDWLSNLKCNDLLCKISYTTLVFNHAVLITQNDQINILFLNAGFVSHVPEQSHRPPIG